MATSCPAARGDPFGPKLPAKIPISPRNEPPSSPPPLRVGKTPAMGKKTVIASDFWLLSMAAGTLVCGGGVTGAALLGGGAAAWALSKLPNAALADGPHPASSYKTTSLLIVVPEETTRVMVSPPVPRTLGDKRGDVIDNSFHPR